MSLSQSRIGAPRRPLGFFGSAGPSAVGVNSAGGDFCACCGARPGLEKKLLNCAKCKTVSYCGRECQAEHWGKEDGHKLVCKQLAAQAAHLDRAGLTQALAEGGKCLLCLDMEPVTPAAAKTLACKHRYHRECVEGLLAYGVEPLAVVCPVCHPRMPDGPDQRFDAAARRLFVLERRAARLETAWDALAEEDERAARESVEQLEGSAAAGHKHSLCLLGLLHHLGHASPEGEPDDVEAVRLWQLSAADGIAKSGAEVGTGGARGLARAQYNLSVAYREGRGGLARSDAQALAWALRAAEQGQPEAMANLAACFELGEGTEDGEPDGAEAWRWLLRAAEAGHAPSMLAVSGRYAAGAAAGTAAGGGASSHGPKRDEAEAVKWVRRAAEEGGDPRALCALGGLHEEGGTAGVPQSDALAVAYYTRSADGGYPEGQFRLGRMYLAGRGMAVARIDGVAEETGGSAGGGGSGASEDVRLAHALAYFMLAGAQGHSEAQASVAELRPPGKGAKGGLVELPSLSAEEAKKMNPAELIVALAQSAEAAGTSSSRKKGAKKKK